MKKGDVAEDTKGNTWVILAKPKDGMVRVASAIQPLSAYTAPVADLTVLPGVTRRGGV